ncbi:MAG: ATP synthase F0 subunit C [Lachnospiraceae bacterium]|nr:ATP synthase F0 subunit C [Lachnospiraceae bacterium]
MKHLKRISVILAAIILVMGVVTVSGLSAQAASDTTEAAAEAAADSATGAKAIAAALAIGIVGAAGAVSMGISIAKSNEGVARQPEAAGKIQTQLMLGLVFIETAIIYALIVAILIVFVM